MANTVSRKFPLASWLHDNSFKISIIIVKYDKNVFAKGRGPEASMAQSYHGPKGGNILVIGPGLLNSLLTWHPCSSGSWPVLPLRSVSLKSDCCRSQHQTTSDFYVTVSYKLNAPITNRQNVTTRDNPRRIRVIMQKPVIRNVKCYSQRSGGLL